MKLLDTNIVMYALGRAHPLKDRCQSILRDIARADLSANVNTEVMQELLYVYSARGERKKGLRVVDEMLILFPNPFEIGKTEIITALNLMKKYSFLVARDALHCAVSLNKNLEGIITSDRDFEKVKEVLCFKP